MNEKPEALRLAEELYAFHAAKKEMPSVGGQMLGLESYRIVTTREVFSQILDAADKLLRQHAEIERLKAVALQAQNAAMDLAKKIPRLSADDAAQVIGMMNERSVRMTECRDPSEACLYPQCMVAGGRCNLLMNGLCSGPRAANPQQVGR